MLRLGRQLAGIRWHFTLVSPHPLALNSLARPPPVSLGSHCAMIGKKLIVLEIKHCLTKRLLKSPTIHRTFQIGKEINAGTNKTGVDQKRSGELWARRGNTWVAFDQVASHCIEAMVASISFQTTVTLYSQPHPPSPKLYSSISPSFDPSPRVTAGKRSAVVAEEGNTFCYVIRRAAKVFGWFANVVLMQTAKGDCFFLYQKRKEKIIIDITNTLKYTIQESYFIARKILAIFTKYVQSSKSIWVQRGFLFSECTSIK